MFKKQHPQVGARPGTLVIHEDALPSKIRVVQYSLDEVSEQEVWDAVSLEGQVKEGCVTWIDIQGLGDERTIRALARQFDLHPLAVEDVVNTPQRPKTEAYGQQQLVIARRVKIQQSTELVIEQVSIILGPDYVITFQESHEDLFQPVRQRIQQENARLRQQGPDYLVYAILDTIVDGYYPILESLGDQLERLEDAVLERPHPQLLRRLNSVKKRLVNLRRIIWPQRDAVNALMRDDSALITDQVRLFLRDTYDHCVQTSEVVEMYRETATGLLNTYLSSVGHRTNEVMRVLTIMSSIFVPLTFLAGIYGMNFEHMPELSFQWAYPSVWLAMFCVVGGMLFFFYRKGWIGRNRFRKDHELVLRDAATDASSAETGRSGSAPRHRTVDLNQPHVFDQPDGTFDLQPVSPPKPIPIRRAG